MNFSLLARHARAPTFSATCACKVNQCRECSFLTTCRNERNHFKNLSSLRTEDKFRLCDVQAAFVGMDYEVNKEASSKIHCEPNSYSNFGSYMQSLMSGKFRSEECYINPGDNRSALSHFDIFLSHCNSGAKVYMPSASFSGDTGEEKMHNVISLSLHNQSAQVCCKGEVDIERSIDSEQMSSSEAEGSKLPDHRDDLPNQEQLQIIFDNLQKTLPEFFKSSSNFDFWKYNSTDIEFIDNIRNRRTKGAYRYAVCAMWIKLQAHTKFSYVNFDILKMTQHPEEGTVKVRWRIRGLPGWQVMYTYWKFKMWQGDETLDKHEIWYDGFSTFYIGCDGNIFRHVADKVMPDDERAIKKPSLADRLSMAFTGNLAGPKLYKDTRQTASKPQ